MTVPIIPDFLVRTSLAEAMFDLFGFVVVDLNSGEILWANRMAEKIFGYQMQGELQGQLVDVLVPEALRDKHINHRKGFAANPQPRAMNKGLMLQGRKRDGSGVPVAVSLVPKVIEKRPCVVAIILDMTAGTTEETH